MYYIIGINGEDFREEFALSKSCGDSVLLLYCRQNRFPPQQLYNASKASSGFQEKGKLNTAVNSAS